MITFLHFTRKGGRVTVVLTKIVGIVEVIGLGTHQCTEIYMDGCSSPFVVDETMDEICERLAKLNGYVTQ